MKISSRDALARLLAAHGYSIRTAADSQEAMQEMANTPRRHRPPRHRPPPRPPGDSFATFLNIRYPKARIIFMSGQYDMKSPPNASANKPATSRKPLDMKTPSSKSSKPPTNPPPPPTRTTPPAQTPPAPRRRGTMCPRRAAPHPMRTPPAPGFRHSSSEFDSSFVICHSSSPRARPNSTAPIPSPPPLINPPTPLPPHFSRAPPSRLYQTRLHNEPVRPRVRRVASAVPRTSEQAPPRLVAPLHDSLDGRSE